MRLKEIEKDAKREEILNAARNLFATKGFESTSMEEIAKSVGIAKGTVYLYFESKYVLFFEVINFAKENMVEQVRQIRDTSLPILEKIKQMILIQLNFMERYPEYGRIFMMMHYSASDQLKESIIKFFNQDSNDLDALQIVMDLFEEGVKSGELRSPLNVREEVYRIWQLGHGLSMVKNITESDVFKKSWKWAVQRPDKEILQETIEIILEFYKKPEGV